MEDSIRDGMSGVAGDAACVGCLSRRAFVARTAGLAAVVAFLEACGENGITDPAGTMDVTVSDFPDLATVDRLVSVGGNRAVKRTGPASFAAYSMRCTHEGTRVNISGGTSFVCPNHGARFDNDGHVTLGPATRDLSVLATSYDPTTDTLTIG